MKKNLCKCGCGMMVREGKIFIHGHNMKGKKGILSHSYGKNPWNKKELNVDEILSLYFKEKMSCQDIANKMNCSRCSIQIRIKKKGFKLRTLSEAQKLKLKRYWLGKKAPSEMVMKNKMNKIEWWKENKNSEKGCKILNSLKNSKTGNLKSITKGKTYEDMYGIEKTKEIIKKLRIARAKQNFSFTNSSIELKIQNFLKQLGVEFYTHFCISEIEHAYNCDIFIPSKKLVIECDGDYFHGNPNLFPINKLNKKQIEQKERDSFRNKELVEKGYNLLRIWENEIVNMNINQFNNKLLQCGVIQ